MRIGASAIDDEHASGLKNHWLLVACRRICFIERTKAVN
jgi:hypothetical protein